MPGKGTVQSIWNAQASSATIVILTHAVLMHMSDPSLHSERGLLLMAPNAFMMHTDCPGIRRSSRVDLIPGIALDPATGTQPVVSILFDGWEYDEETLYDIGRILNMATPRNLPRAEHDILRYGTPTPPSPAYLLLLNRYFNTLPGS